MTFGHHFGTNAITALDAHGMQSYMVHAHYPTTQRYLHHKRRPEHAPHVAIGGKQMEVPCSVTAHSAV